jgi:NADH-quinone oxidoreductase subunit J
MFLILAFFNAAGLFVLFGAEFLAMLLVIVYVGAIAVLFLFVVMMLNIDQEPNTKEGANKYLYLAIFIACVLFVEIFLIIKSSTMLFSSHSATSIPIDQNISNTKAIGNVLYTKFIYPFQISGIILFVSMIGAIVLTLRDQNRFIKKQNISKQVTRTKSKSISLAKVEAGKGIDF